MPDNVYFRQPDTQRMLLDVLFIFCKLNPDTSYRQGMHEVLAPILWVVERDAVDPGTLKQPVKSSEDELLLSLLDHVHIEHDAFTLFGLVMQNAKSFYEQPANVRQSAQSSVSAAANQESAMLRRSRKIFEYYLPKVDPTLASHLTAIDVVPQIFLMLDIPRTQHSVS
jgi:TBC1 domain family member 5